MGTFVLTSHFSMGTLDLNKKVASHLETPLPLPIIIKKSSFERIFGTILYYCCYVNYQLVTDKLFEISLLFLNFLELFLATLYICISLQAHARSSILLNSRFLSVFPRLFIAFLSVFQGMASSLSYTILSNIVNIVVQLKVLIVHIY